MTAQEYEVKAGLEKLDPFDILGISAIIKDRDTASETINALWQKFFEQSVGQMIENRVDDVIYAVYSDYEGDHTKPYRITIGYKVENTDQLSESFHHVQVKQANYAMMSAAGEQPKALLETWEAIWQSDLDRCFETDFEVYGRRFFEDGVHEVLVAIGVNL
ncbi:MAG: GyrI-like domain-containing protein [Alphaproteobacteria bacterium]